MTAMKLQKLVYYAHGWNLVLQNSPLIEGEIQAWEYGPVIPTLYHEFKHFGHGPIVGRAVEYDEANRTVYRPVVPPDDTYTVALLEKTWEVFGRYSSIQLSNMTHAQGTPWSIISQQYRGHIPHGTRIPNDLIRDVFSRLPQQNPQQGAIRQSIPTFGLLHHRGLHLRIRSFFTDR